MLVVNLLGVKEHSTDVECRSVLETFPELDVNTHQEHWTPPLFQEIYENARACNIFRRVPECTSLFCSWCLL